jgi:hypothetical protein
LGGTCPERKKMSALEWLIYRCNEMDITEQLNYLGDAVKPYQAKLEADKQRLHLTALRRWLTLSIFINVILLALVLTAIGGRLLDGKIHHSFPERK